MVDGAYWLDLAWKLSAVAFFLVLNGFFVAAEFAIVRVRDTQLRNLGRGPRMTAALHATKHLDSYLSACQLGITFASLGLGWIGEPAVSHILVEPALGTVIASEGTLRALSIAVGFVLISALHIVVGELAPKSLAIRRPTETALGAAFPLRVFRKVFAPFIWALNGTANALVRMIGIRPSTEAHDFTVDEIRMLLAQVPAKEGTLKRSAELAGRVFELHDRKVRDIMVPRDRMTYLDLLASSEENMRIVKSSKHTRFPLAEGGPDTILGFVHEKDLYNAQDRGEQPDMAKLRREVLVVPQTQSVSRTLFEMLEKKRMVGVVVDEAGNTVGMLTMEDVLEEIVGEIPGEFDQPEHYLTVKGPGEYVVDAIIPIHELQLVLREPLKRRTAASLGGLLNEALGHIPEPGESTRIGNYVYTVVSADKFRAKAVEIRRVETPPQPATL